jgi:hypothetical protein
MPSWDDNWVRALVTVIAAAAGAVIAGVINMYASRQKIKEIEIQYRYKLRDGYLENARKVAGEVYIPIGIYLTSLSNNYENYLANMESIDRSIIDVQIIDVPLNKFKNQCIQYLICIDELLKRGADAYLTTILDESLNDFTNFIRNSIERDVVVKKVVFQAILFSFGLSTTQTMSEECDTASGYFRKLFAKLSIEALSIDAFGISFSYSEKVLAAPLNTKEFEARMKAEIPKLKFLIKEVVLGSNPAVT